VRDRRSENLTRHLAATWTDSAASPLRVRRLAARLTQPELAERARVSVATVDRAERTDSASEASWFALASTLGVDRAVIDREYAAKIAPFVRAGCWE